MFNDSMKRKSQTTSIFDSWNSERENVSTGLQYQVDNGSARKNFSPKCIIAAHQTEARIEVPNEWNKIAIFDNLYFRKSFCDIDGGRDPKDSVNKNYDGNDYLDQCGDLYLIYKEHVGGDLLNLFISYPDMKNFHPIRIKDLRFQVDNIYPNKSHLFEELGGDPAKATIFIIWNRHSEIKMVSDGNKITEFKLIKKLTAPSLKHFTKK